MTPDKLRQKIDTAKKQNDPEALERAIAECVSSGHSELLPDIQEARFTLQPTGDDRSGGIFSPGSPSSIIKRPDVPGAGRMSGDYTVSPDTTSNVFQSRYGAQYREPGQRDYVPEIKSPETLRGQLRLAMKERDPDSLDKLIYECENARYPELGYEIRQARDVLNELGGGRGGVRSPELLRDQLREAIRQKDKKILRDILKDCLSVGLPELDADIQQAREILDKMQGGRGAIKLPKDISEHLRSAVKQKSRPELEKSIIECEEAGYPELSLDLRQARDTLESMGFGRGGSKSPEKLRERLESARKRRDKEGLEKALNDCIISGHPQLQSDIQQARNLLDNLSDVRGGLLSPGSPRSPGSPHSPRSPYSSPHSSQSPHSPYSPRSTQSPHSPLSPCSPRGGVRRQAKQNVGQTPSETPLTQQTTQTTYQPRESPQTTSDASRDTSTEPMSAETLRDDIKSAMKNEDRGHLERLIQECERTEYPEIGYDLQDARLLLKRLGGGYGGSKSPDYYRDQLKQSINQRDKTALDRAIKQSVASGLPGLESDIYRARNTLNLLEGGMGGIKPSKDIRDRLKNAIRQKNRSQLEKAIIECEEASYPELSRDLCEARDTLESMGFGRGGTKTPDTLREKLETALRNNDRETLEKVIDDCISSGHPELMSEITQTRKYLDGQGGISGRGAEETASLKPTLSPDRPSDTTGTDKPGMITEIPYQETVSSMPSSGRGVRFPRSKSPDTLRNELKSAIQQKDAPTLHKIITECENAKYPELCHQLREARQIHKQLRGNPGGSLNPETLREQLKDATRQKDANLLDKSIKICLASGFPELDADINRARDNLDILEGGQGGLPCSETLREQLRNACQNKSRSQIESAIIECEAAAYPELNDQLRDARLCLEGLGFGRGGSKTLESLRISLDTAKRQNDRHALERAIDECVMSGHPELTSDIQNAREILDYMDDYEGVSLAPGSPWPTMKGPEPRELFGQLPGQIPGGYRVAPEMAHRVFEDRQGITFGRPGARPADILDRDLKRAIQQKDQPNLEKLIAECEGAEYPQLGHTLRSARLNLRQMGGGNGGVQSPDYFRDQLREAVSQNDIKNLERVIKQCVAAGFPDLDSDIQKARESLYTLQGGQGGLKTPDSIREQLRPAIALKDPKALERVILDCEATGYPELAIELHEARDTLESLTGSRGGNKTPKLLREKLEAAKVKGDSEELENVIDECLIAGHPEIVPEVVKTRELFACRKDYPGDAYRNPTSDYLRDQLKVATLRNDRDALENLINECETCAYPELGYDLQEARATLQQLGGGYGGTMSPETIREQLRMATKQKDKKLLDKAIQEAVAAGFPELESDILQARNTRDTLQGGRGGLKSASVLRDQLKSAIQQNNKPALERAIVDAENAVYPELSQDIRNAREALERLGGGRGGRKNPEDLRDKLKMAIRKNDKDALEKVLQECVAAGFPQLTRDIDQAREVLETLGGGRKGYKNPDSLRSQLRMVIDQKNRAGLEKLINECEEYEYTELGNILQEARETLDSLGGGFGGIKSSDSLRERLQSAIQRKDKPALETLIKECIAAGFPELVDDIKKARDTLDIMQGGRGATKSAESIREKLKTAIQRKSRPSLERAINEAEAARYPELAYDLRQARDTLESLGGGRGGSVSPETLRDRLKRAMKLKDRQALEKAIEECVASGHPELLADVQQARDVLDSIGGGRKASKPTDVLRDQLKAAMKTKHPASLERAIAEAEASKDPQLMAEVQSAKKMLDAVWPARAGSPEEVKNLRAKLESAMRRDDAVEMQKIMMEIEQKNLSDYLTVEVGDARSRLQGQAQPDPEGHFARADASVDVRSASRFGQYSQYGTMSHDLLIAALVVIGENERRLGNWKSYQHFFEMAQADRSTRRVLGLDIEHIYQDLSARADEILTRHSTDEVHLMNRSGHMAYTWSRLLNQQMFAHFNSFSSSGGAQSGGAQSGGAQSGGAQSGGAQSGGARSGRTSSSSFGEGTVHMSQTGRTDFQTSGGSRFASYTSEGPTSTYQFSQGSRRDDQNGGTGFTSYTTSSKYSSGYRRL